MTWPGWDTELLGALGLPATPERLRFLHAWQRAEGGSARYNPLNTTYGLGGSTDYNRVHVKHYLDPLHGLAATILTLRLPFYADLRAALAAHDLTALQIAERSRHGLTSWGTGYSHVAALLRSRSV